MKTSMLFNLAWHNLWRNRRRSLVTILSLSFGFCAIALFAGYTNATYKALARASIHGELVGHLTVQHPQWETQGKLHPDRFLLRANEIASVQKIVAQQLPQAHVIPQLSVSGLLSNGHSSTIFVGRGIAPADLDILRGPFRNASGALSATDESGVVLAQGLADILNMKNGDNASLLVSTIHGQANAADANIIDSADTGNAATNDKLMRMPLSMAQSLMDAPERAESLTVLLEPAQAVQQVSDLYTQEVPDEAQTQRMADQLTQAMQQQGLSLQVKTWQTMSVFYRQVKAMYDMIFSMMLAVVLSIVVLSIANAMSMAVIERTREIGTLRAIGLRRWGIVRLFAAEAFWLVILGLATGWVLSAGIRYGINAADIRWIPPNSTSSVPLYIGQDHARSLFAALLLGALALLAAIIPARRASKHPITELLGHV